MKLAILTARLPTGSGEAFLIPEILELQRAGAELVVIPLRRSERTLHRDAGCFASITESLLSWNVFKGALGEMLQNPKRTISMIIRLLSASRGVVRIQTIAAVPKMLWLAALVRRLGVDHIHAYWASTVATVAMGAAEITSRPWSFTAHRYDVVSNGFLDEKSISASFVRSISQATTAAARSHSPEFARKARVLHLGVHVPEVATPRRRDAFIVLSPAAFRSNKGHDVLIEGFSRLVRHRPDALLMLAGEGRLRGEVESLVESKGLGKRVRFLGALPHEELLSLYAAGDVDAVALASYDTGDGLPEGIPVSLMEAMAYGLPVVATDAGGTAELLGGGAGLLIAQHDPVGLSDALLKIANDSKFSTGLGRLARDRVSAEFEVRRITREFLGIITACKREGGVFTS